MIDVNATVWAATDRGTVERMRVLEIEQTHLKQVRLQDVNGKIVYRDVHELHPTELAAARAGLSNELHLSTYYETLRNRCLVRARLLRRRLDELKIR